MCDQLDTVDSISRSKSFMVEKPGFSLRGSDDQGPPDVASFQKPGFFALLDLLSMKLDVKKLDS